MTEPERKPVYHCSWCGNEIYAGDPYYEIAYMGIVCERCMDECKHYAEKPDVTDVWEEDALRGGGDR